MLLKMLFNSLFKNNDSSNKQIIKEVCIVDLEGLGNNNMLVIGKNWNIVSEFSKVNIFLNKKNVFIPASQICF